MRKITRFMRLQLVLVVLAVFALAGVVHAELLCRSDPVVILSNGVTLDIGASISTMPWQVNEVHYELHVPKGVFMIAAIHTPAWLTSQETFTVVADQAAGQYQVMTDVSTSVGGAIVVADTTLVSALNIKLGRYTVSGLENTPLMLRFQNSVFGR